MSAILIGVVCVVFGSDPVESQTAVRSPGQLRQAVHDGLKKWSNPSAATAKPAARELLALYREIQSNADLSPASREEMERKLYRRLTDLSALLKMPAAGAEKKPAEVASIKADAPARALAQVAPIGMGRGAMVGGAMAGGMQRGQNSLALTDDAGDELADIIQSTIAPDSWERNGGPGAIVYWAQGRALVVRQTGEVHHRLGELVQQLEQVVAR